MQQRKTYLLTLFLSLGMMTPAEAVVQTFNDKAAFLTATAASSASGPLPDLGPVGEPTTVGTVTFWLAPGGNTLSIGTRDTVAAPDWYPLMEGNEIALGYENLQVQTAAPVFALGFDFVEPDTTMPSFGGAPVDSPYEVVLYAGSLEVGRTSFNALDDEIGFVGVWNDRAFDRVTIIDTTGNHDDEFFGEFYTGALACSGERCSVAQASQCAANKIESSGTYMDAALDCYAKAASKGQAVARDCLQQAEGKLASSFASAEDAGACKTIGDTATIETTLDTAVANLVAAVGGSGPSQCTEQKLNAVGEDAESQHRCYANAIAKGAGHSVEIECQTKATQRFLADFTRAEAKGDCARGTTGGPAVDAKVGVTVRRIRAVLSRPVTTCAPVEVMAMHGEGFLGNARLAKIAHGKVPCMHSEEGKITTCSFSTVPGSESGE